MGGVGSYCLAFILLVFGSYCLAQQVTPLPKSVARGVNFPVYVPSLISEEVITSETDEMVKDFHLEWVSLELLWHQEDIHSNVVTSSEETPSSEWIAQYVKQVKKRNLKLLIKPIITLPSNASVYITPSNVTAWFESYTKMVLSLAQTCQENNVEALAVGLEIPFVAVPINNRNEWISLIAKVRKIYSGKLTYAALYTREYPKIPFWDALDWIGIEAYWPLANETNINPSIPDMVNYFTNAFEEVKQWKQSNVTTRDKPLYFTELGYPSLKTAAIYPTVFPTRSEGCRGKFSPDFELQAKCYSALFSTLPKYSDVISGLFIFSWDNPSTADYYPTGPLWACFYSPRGKPAYEIISQAYSP